MAPNRARLLAGAPAASAPRAGRGQETSVPGHGVRQTVVVMAALPGLASVGDCKRTLNYEEPPCGLSLVFIFALLCTRKLLPALPTLRRNEGNRMPAPRWL